VRGAGWEKQGLRLPYEGGSEEGAALYRVVTPVCTAVLHCLDYIVAVLKAAKGAQELVAHWLSELEWNTGVLWTCRLPGITWQFN
jgi:hypothetical protein